MDLDEEYNGSVAEEERGNDKKFRYRPKTENLKRGRLIVRNLPFKIKEDQLKKDFEKFGEISEMNLLKKPDGKLVGCCFIQYKEYKDSCQAIQGMNGKKMLGRAVTVDFAVSKDRYDQIKKSNENEMKEEPKEIKEEEIKEEKCDLEDTILPESQGNVEEFDADNELENDYGNSEEKYIKPEIKKEKIRDANEHEFTIFVKNMSFETTDQDLLECFKPYGPIKYAIVVKDHVSGHSKGSGFVKFLRKESVNQCLQQTGLIKLHHFELDIMPSLPRQKIQSLESQKKHVDPKDNRHLYLTKEGTVIAGSTAAEGVSATDMSKRLRLEQIKTTMLKNLNRFISRDRLTIHNIPDGCDDAKLRNLVTSRTNMNPVECRVMRENKPTADNPKGKSKGFGFLSFKKHEDALLVLRKLNNNPNVFSAANRPIVAFSIEDKNVLNIKKRRLERSLTNNPTYQKKMEELKVKKAKKNKERKDKKLKLTDNKIKPTPPTEENVEAYSGYTTKPGQQTKIRGTFKLKQQSMIHEKSTLQQKKLAKKEKQQKDIRKAQMEKNKEKKTSKRKVTTETTDSLTKMIEKYKSMIKSNDDGPASKKARGKWYVE